MKTTIELEGDQIDAIIKQELSLMVSTLESDLNTVKESDQGYIFSKDKKEDIAEIKKHIKSFKRVIKYYGGSL
jgi:hypothetical protein